MVPSHAGNRSQTPECHDRQKIRFGAYRYFELSRDCFQSMFKEGLRLPRPLSVRGLMEKG
jgi:hypothetical protein